MGVGEGDREGGEVGSGGWLFFDAGEEVVWCRAEGSIRPAALLAMSERPILLSID